MSDTAESVGLPFTADLMFGLINTDELEEKGQMMVKQLKNRIEDVTKYSKFLIGVDRPKMKFYDIEETGQGQLVDSGHGGDDGGNLNRGRERKTSEIRDKASSWSM
jgi:hypothetical protein